jgi:hypothetical protein
MRRTTDQIPILLSSETSVTIREALHLKPESGNSRRSRPPVFDTGDQATDSKRVLHSVPQAPYSQAGHVSATLVPHVGSHSAARAWS